MARQAALGLLCLACALSVVAPLQAQWLAAAATPPPGALPGAGAGASAPSSAPAPLSVSRDELEVVMTEVARLRAEVAALRGELAAAKVASAPTPVANLVPVPAAANAQPQQAAPSVEMLRAQVDEMSQTKVESTSRMPVRIFGAIVSNTVSNSGMANWLENPTIADAEIAGVEPGSFTSTLRQSQIGLNVGPIPMGGDWIASGALVADFYGGTPGFVTGTVFGLPRMVYAFARLEHGGTAFVIGQDHNLLSPRDPTSLAAQSFPLLFESGNLYLRSPQVRMEQRFGGLALKGGMFAPIAADANNFYVFGPAAGAGERSGRPAFEGRADYTAGDADSPSEFSLGVAARYGWRRPGLELNSTASYGADFNARVGRLGVAGEYFTTDDAAEFGSAVAQARPAQGGWVEGRLRLTSKLSTNVGLGMDEVDAPVPAAARSENRSVFGNVIFNFTPEVAVSMEYRWLETSLGSAIKRTNDHINAAFVVRF